MSIFSGSLICTDLDGTLYRNDKTISAENKRAIEYYKSEGGYFTFVTGRLPYYSTDAYRKISPNAPYGCINGGGVYDGDAHRYIWATTLPREAMELVAYIDERFHDVGIQVCCHDRTYFARENEVTVRFRRLTGVPRLVADYKEVGEPVGKILFCSDKDEEILAIARALNGHPLSSQFDFVRSERTLYEILPKGVNKGLALTKIAEHLGIDIEKTIAIGDYDNDVGMLLAAGVGIAVANASPTALRAADLTTVSNEEDAIARVIYDLKDGIIKL